MQNKFLIPSAIIVAGLLVGGALLLTGKDTPDNTPGTENNGEIVINDITNDDHILGNPNAEIKIVEYSDIDCPFCANFHETMNRIVDEYGPSGEVAWIYRHFPLAQLHPDATKKAEASECVADLGGNEAFWNYMDILFEREDEGVLDLADIAASIGVNKSDFEDCLSSDEFASEVQEDADDAQRAGAQGTPHSIIVIKATGERVALSGAQPYESVKEIVEAILSGESQ